ncbi:hypothetical protein LOZ65_003703 [Ophidiomyces ophidiicola]|nr:hypothetical protein LOZ65_003703 [Ophidiomyces ophidiicola]
MKSPTSQQGPQCQFSGEACSTDSPHYRKVISHIFGRNKRCTIGVPNFVWIYYCRKHYQRARYRTGEWPFRQCDLAIDTIKNMRSWGGVDSFNLQLRRRETKRSTEVDEICEESDLVVHNKRRSHASDGDSSGDFVINLEDELSAAETPEPRETLKKRSPRIIARPVPGWLHDYLGNEKTFSEILRMLRDLRQHMHELVETGEDAHFPDIEILPNLRQKHTQSRREPSKNRRTTSRGGIRKVAKK